MKVFLRDTWPEPDEGLTLHHAVSTFANQAYLPAHLVRSLAATYWQRRCSRWYGDGAAQISAAWQLSLLSRPAPPRNIITTLSTLATCVQIDISPG